MDSKKQSRLPIRGAKIAPAPTGRLPENKDTQDVDNKEIPEEQRQGFHPVIHAEQGVVPALLENPASQRSDDTEHGMDDQADQQQALESGLRERRGTAAPGSSEYREGLIGSDVDEESSCITSRVQQGAIPKVSPASVENASEESDLSIQDLDNENASTSSRRQQGAIPKVRPANVDPAESDPDNTSTSRHQQGAIPKVRQSRENAEEPRMGGVPLEVQVVVREVREETSSQSGSEMSVVPQQMVQPPRQSVQLVPFFPTALGPPVVPYPFFLSPFEPPPEESPAERDMCAFCRWLLYLWELVETLAALIYCNSKE